MNYVSHLNGFFGRLSGDERLSSYHISLYLALFQQWNAERFADEFVISRAEMMHLARIGSANTYARCMRELSEWGYIRYKFSSNLHCGSRVSCIRFDTREETVSSTATGTGTTGSFKSDTAGDTASGTGIRKNTAAGTGYDTAGNTGTSGSIGNDTRTGTAGDTGITAGRKTDTGSDTLLINITNNLKQKEKKEKNQREIPEKEPEAKSGLPDLSEVILFFRINREPEEEARRFFNHYRSAGWQTAGNTPIVSWQSLARKWITNIKNFNSYERQPNPVGAGRFSVPTDKDYSEPL